MPRSRTRARHPFNPEWPRARAAQLYREVDRRLTKLYAGEKRQHQRSVEAAKKKALGLAAEGSSNLVIPGEDPEPPETYSPAEAPVRRAARWTGMTVLND